MGARVSITATAVLARTPSGVAEELTGGQRPRPDFVGPGASRSLERQAERLVEQRADPGEELGAVGAVEHPVIARERDRHQTGRGDLAVPDHGAFLDRADREERGLGRVYHRREARD